MNANKILSVFLSVIMLMTCFSVTSFAAGSTLSEINDKIKEAKSQLEEGKEEQNDLLSQIDDLNAKMEEVESEIAELDGQIDEKTAQIDTKQAELDSTQAELDQQNAALSERLRVMYKSGETGIMEVILGSSDIVEMISNIHMVQTIYDYDMEVLDKIQKQYQVLDRQRTELQSMKDDLESSRAEKQTYEDELNADLSELEELEAKVASDNEALEAQIDKLNREANALTAEMQRGAIQSSSSATSTYSGGIFLWPVPNYARISSYFGYRMHPILGYTKFHSGLDIAASSGTPILAANGGTVIFSGTRNGYGKTIMIDHGGGLVTIYGHNSSLSVGEGQRVSQGQVVALAGSTGYSTGPHCHFEVRLHGEVTEPLNYLP
jgi:Membrane proteins related to metalloendopeptidases